MTSRRQQKKTLRSMQRARQQQRPLDPFGLDRERRLIESNVRNVFTPHQPISESTFLFGRTSEVGAFITALNTPGRHALLYGDRGVGKTSLANVVNVLHETASGIPSFVKRCDRRDTFETIVRDALLAVNRNPNITSMELTSVREKGIGLDFSGLSAQAGQSKTVSSRFDTAGYFSPSTVAQALSQTPAVLIVDEADALAERTDREQLAEVIKLLSDYQSPFKVMIVGIAETADQLTAAHPSVRRCLSEKRLGRMTDAELREILTAGAMAVGISFVEEVANSIVHMSLGYPHFTHLLGLKSAERAIGDNRRSVTMTDLREAISSAVDDSEGSLTKVYSESIRSASTDMFHRVVVAAAKLGSIEFSAADLRAQLSKDTGREIAQNSLNNYFQRLVSADGSTILRRTAHGHYRFEDPRMASFVRMANSITRAS